jgi:hypothetical protein
MSAVKVTRRNEDRFDIQKVATVDRAYKATAAQTCYTFIPLSRCRKD